MKVITTAFSYTIIALITFMISMSYLNALHLIKQEEITIYRPVLPNLEDRYLLEPIVNLIAADLAS